MPYRKKPLSLSPYLLAALALASMLPAAAQEPPPFFEPLPAVFDDTGGTQGLGRAWDTVTSPDGGDLYSVSIEDDALVHWTLGSGGALEQQEIYRAGFNAPLLLDQAFDLEFSPDGRFLYVAAAESQVLVFRRNETTGALTYVDAYDPEGGVCEDSLISRLGSATDILLSPDGSRLFLLVGAPFSSTTATRILTVLARDPGSGLLTGLHCYDRMEVDGLGEIAIFRGGVDQALSADGRFLYLASVLWGVVVLEIDPVTGEVSYLERLAQDDDVESPARVALSPDGAHLYAMSYFGDEGEGFPGLWIFGRNSANGRLTLVSTCCELAEPLANFSTNHDLLISADGRHLYAAGFEDSTVVHFRRDPASGAVTLEGRSLASELDTNRPDGVTGLSFGPGETVLYATSPDADSLFRLSRSASSGALTLEQRLRDGEGAEVTGLQGVTDSLFSADGRHLLVASSSDNALTVFEVEAGGGITRQVSSTVATPEDSSGPYGLQLSGDGRVLFVEGGRRGLDVFSFEPGSGELTHLGGRHWAFSAERSWTVPRDAENVYSLREEGGLTIATFDRATGEITETELVEELERPDGSTLDLRFLFPVDLDVSRDGRHLFFAHPSGLLVLTRDRSDGGRLSLAAEVSGTFPDGTGAGGLTSLVTSPDGRNLYGLVNGLDHEEVVVFFRNRETGALTYLERAELPAGDGIVRNAPQDLAFTDDGLHLFVSATPNAEFPYWGDGDLAVFVRNPRTGRLSPLEEKGFGDEGLVAFVRPNAVAVSPTEDVAAISTEAGLQLFRKGEIPCPVAGEGLCLNEDRFAVEVDWRRANGTEGSGTPVEFRSDDSGLFWFFQQENWEMLVKVLDGCSFNSQFWVFSAATTNVEYELQVADRLSGLRRTYANTQGTAAPALTDTGAFGACLRTANTEGSSTAPARSADLRGAPLSRHPALTGTCVPDDVTLCLNGGRFKVELAWERRDGLTGVGHPVPFGSDDSGLLWFFREANWEMLIKVLDGCTNNGHYWVFSAATTTVEYTLRVTDTVSGQIREYFNPLGNSAATITDTFAFETCS